MRSRGFDAVINDSLIGGVLAFAQIIAGLVTGIAAALIAYYGFDTDWRAWAGAGFIIGVMLMVVVTEVVEAAVITLFIWSVRQLREGEERTAQRWWPDRCGSRSPLVSHPLLLCLFSLIQPRRRSQRAAAHQARVLQPHHGPAQRKLSRSRTPERLRRPSLKGLTAHVTMCMRATAAALPAQRKIDTFGAANERGTHQGVFVIIFPSSNRPGSRCSTQQRATTIFHVCNDFDTIFKKNIFRCIIFNSC